MHEQLVRALLELLEGGGRGALATVVRTAGSTPQVVGARLLLRPDGTLAGTVGGGAIEQDVVEALHGCVLDGESRLLSRELGYDLAMCCGGRMEVFIEPIEGAPRLSLLGAGHVAHALAPLAHALGFLLRVVDEREELNTEARFPNATRVLLDPAEWLKHTSVSERDWLLIASHDHALDERLLELSLLRTPRYVGLVGSKRKVFRLLERISRRRGALSLARLYAPVGVALGGVGPHEIAVSIAAELVALRRNTPAAHLRVMDDPRLAKLLAAPSEEA